MDAKRQSEELISRVVAMVIYYHHLGSDRPNKAAMCSEFMDLADEAAKQGLDRDLVISGVWRELYLRYERDTAVRLHGELVSSFPLTHGSKTAGS
jgi:hypothetical protein